MPDIISPIQCWHDCPVCLAPCCCGCAVIHECDHDCDDDDLDDCDYDEEE
jgi:hypothetical protein